MRAPILSLVTQACLVIAIPAVQAEELVSFSQQIGPVLRTQCATCHMTGSEPGGMKLYPSAAHQSLVAVASVESPLQRVAPGEPDKSYLLHKLQGTHLNVGGQGVQMPFGQPPLSEATREVIRQWIVQGALDN